MPPRMFWCRCQYVGQDVGENLEHKGRSEAQLRGLEIFQDGGQSGLQCFKRLEWPTDFYKLREEGWEA